MIGFAFEVGKIIMKMSVILFCHIIQIPKILELKGDPREPLLAIVLPSVEILSDLR